MEVVWSEKAEDTFFKNIEYLEKHWTEKVVENFENETYRVIEIISKNPHLGRYDQRLKCSIIPVTKQISVFYDVFDSKIVLLTFWDNRQKPLTYLDTF